MGLVVSGYGTNSLSYDGYIQYIYVTNCAFVGPSLLGFVYIHVCTCKTVLFQCLECHFNASNVISTAIVQFVLTVVYSY